MKEAPLYVQTFDLALWLQKNLTGTSPLVRLLQEDVLRLLDHVVLALKGFERGEHLVAADELTALLRVRLQLAQQLDLLDERQLLFLADQLDSIGRQLGGWQRRLEQDTVAGHHR